jgi:predicted XRE-type DNA-binding protein
MRKKKKGGVEYYEGSDNVYKDLGYKNPEEWATKAALATKIYDIIEERKMTQKQAAEILRIDQPGVSDLRRGRFRRFSVARLLAFLRALDRDVDIVIRPKVQDIAQIMVAETMAKPDYLC